MTFMYTCIYICIHPCLYILRLWLCVCVCVLLRVVTDFNSNLAIPFWFGSESGKFSLNMSLVRSKALRLLQFVQYYV